MDIADSEYIDDANDTPSLQWYCKCMAGARLVGFCAHVAAFLLVMCMIRANSDEYDQVPTPPLSHPAPTTRVSHPAQTPYSSIHNTPHSAPTHPTRVAHATRPHVAGPFSASEFYLLYPRKRFYDDIFTDAAGGTSNPSMKYQKREGRTLQSKWDSENRKNLVKCLCGKVRYEYRKCAKTKTIMKTKCDDKACLTK